MNDKFVGTYSLLNTYNYRGQVDVERSNVRESFKLHQLEEALDKLPADVSLEFFCHMSILLQSRLSIMDSCNLISVPAAMRQFMTINSGAAHLMTWMWLILLRLLLDCREKEQEI